MVCHQRSFHFFILICPSFFFLSGKTVSPIVVTAREPDTSRLRRAVVWATPYLNMRHHRGLVGDELVRACVCVCEQVRQFFIYECSTIAFFPPVLFFFLRTHRGLERSSDDSLASKDILSKRGFAPCHSWAETWHFPHTSRRLPWLLCANCIESSLQCIELCPN